MVSIQSFFSESSWNPEELNMPHLTSWYLATNLPAPDYSKRAEHSELGAADLAEIVRLYSLRKGWIEQRATSR